MAQVRVEDLVKEFAGGVRAVDRVSFTVEEGQVVTLLGPSGCGKSTILRCIAGLEEPTRGRITIGQTVVHDSDTGRSIPVEERAIGMVFQSYAIWPHLRVFDNVALPLRLRGRETADPAALRQRVVEALRSVGMEEYERRYPSELSGGQQQRVVLARCLVYRPRVLLLDEPLANLDAKLRESMRTEVREVQQRFGLTTIYVTHDQSEALALSDRVIVLKDGRMLRHGSPREVFADPGDPFVADFLGVTNLLAATVISIAADGNAIVRLSGSDVRVTVTGVAPVGDTVTVGIRPRHLALARNAASVPGGLRARVRRVSFLGEELDCVVAIGDLVLKARIPDREDLQAGDDVHVTFLPGGVTLIEGTPATLDTPSRTP